MVVEIYDMDSVVSRLILSLSKTTKSYQSASLGLLASKLNMSYNTLVVRRKRKSIPYKEIINYCRSYAVSLDWILLNRENDILLAEKRKKIFSAGGDAFRIDDAFAAMNILIEAKDEAFSHERIELYQDLLNVEKHKILSSRTRNSVPYREIIQMCDAKSISLNWFFNIDSKEESLCSSHSI